MPITSRPTKLFYHAAGFSLLETLVAVGLLAAVGLAILSWAQSSQQALISSRAAERERDLTRIVLSELRQIDWGKTNEGERLLGDWQFQFKAEPSSSEQQGKALVGNRLFKVQKLRVNVSVAYGRQNEPDSGTFEFAIEQVAFR
jgi:Tfp pilus assembly protein PilV